MDANEFAEGSATYGRISVRLRGRFPANDPAWSPSREAAAPPATRIPGDGRKVSGRNSRPAPRGDAR